MANKMEITFSGFDDLATRIDRMGGDMKTAVDEALTETQKLVQKNLSTAAAIYNAQGRKGYATGKMYGTIIHDAKVKWQGDTAYVEGGFRIRKALESIFIMYGTPRIRKDTKVYNAIKGTATKKQIAEKQEEIMQKYLKIGG